MDATTDLLPPVAASSISAFWKGPREQPLGMAALLVLAVVGMEITGVQPILLGALVAEGRLTNAQLGLATTAEFFTLATVLSLAGALLRPVRLRLIAAIAAIVVIAMDLLVSRLSGTSIIVARGMAGVAEGLLVWMPACMVARAPNAAFWSAASLTLQCTTQLLFAAVLPVTLMASHGADGGFAALAALTLVALAMTPLLPNAFAPLTADHATHRASPIPGPAGIAALAAVFLMAAFAIGLFAYFGLLASESGLSPATLGIAVSAVLGAEIAGGIAATLCARLRYFTALLICLVAYAIVIAALHFRLAATPFILTGALFGFFQVFLMPFQLPLVIESDPSRRAAIVLPGVQLFGAATGPFICSFFVTSSDSRGALTACVIFLAVALAIVAPLHLAHRRRPAPRDAAEGDGGDIYS
ncbi:hypothetical protein M9979_03855 [Sphingomonas sp. RP10(2022)]|uniref:MFS transporter n=1 Tax=Sphingomonas liriopis TaxID=2949094 RepID=A0A9X2HXS5_9SPHN|nr:hypothetical protein [Sphingomonas liriopis]MCP3734010.1 hypothetical protein [Sphingomonas liriopis]